MSTAPKMIWVVCDAPAGGCGRGRRKRQLRPGDKLCCETCGSQVRVCKNQKGMNRSALPIVYQDMMTLSKLAANPIQLVVESKYGPGTAVLRYEHVATLSEAARQLLVDAVPEGSLSLRVCVGGRSLDVVAYGPEAACAALEALAAKKAVRR